MNNFISTFTFLIIIACYGHAAQTYLHYHAPILESDYSDNYRLLNKLERRTDRNVFPQRYYIDRADVYNRPLKSTDYYGALSGVHQQFKVIPTKRPLANGSRRQNYPQTHQQYLKEVSPTTEIGYQKQHNKEYRPTADDNRSTSIADNQYKQSTVVHYHQTNQPNTSRKLHTNSPLTLLFSPETQSTDNHFKYTTSAHQRTPYHLVTYQTALAAHKKLYPSEPNESQSAFYGLQPTKTSTSNSHAPTGYVYETEAYTPKSIRNYAQQQTNIKTSSLQEPSYASQESYYNHSTETTTSRYPYRTYKVPDLSISQETQNNNYGNSDYANEDESKEEKTSLVREYNYRTPERDSYPKRYQPDASDSRESYTNQENDSYEKQYTKRPQYQQSYDNSQIYQSEQIKRPLRYRLGTFTHIH